MTRSPHHSGSRPDEVAIEGVFYAVNVKSALKLGQVRGVAMLRLPPRAEVAEYAPLSIKSAVSDMAGQRSIRYSTWSRGC